MTESEKQEIVSRVLSSLSTNSATIDQLIETGACTDNDYFETGKGNKVSYANMMKPIHQKYDRKFSDLNKDIVKKTTELNISVLYPTGGIGGSNKYDLATAIGKVPEELRVPGLVVSFLNDSNKVEKWEYQGGSWGATANWMRKVDMGLIQESEYDIRNHIIEEYPGLKGVSGFMEIGEANFLEVVTNVFALESAAVQLVNERNNVIKNFFPSDGIQQGDVQTLCKYEIDLTGFPEAKKFSIHNYGTAHADKVYARRIYKVDASTTFNAQKTAVGVEKAEAELSDSFNEYKNATNQRFDELEYDIAYYPQLKDEHGNSVIGNNPDEDSAFLIDATNAYRILANLYTWDESNNVLALRDESFQVLEVYTFKQIGTLIGDRHYTIDFVIKNKKCKYVSLWSFRREEDTYIKLVGRLDGTSFAYNNQFDTTVNLLDSIHVENRDTEPYTARKKSYRDGNNIYNTDSVKWVLLPEDLSKIKGNVLFFTWDGIGISQYDKKLYVADGTTSKVLSVLQFNNRSLDMIKIDLTEFDRAKNLSFTLTDKASRDITGLCLSEEPVIRETKRVRGYALEGLYGKDQWYWDPDKYSLQEAIDYTKENGTLYIPEGIYHIDKRIMVEKAISIIGDGNVKLYGGYAYKTAEQYEGLEDVYHVPVNQEGYGWRNYDGDTWIYQDGIDDSATNIPDIDRHPIYRDRTHRLPMTRIWKTNDLSKVTSSQDDGKLYYKIEGNNMVFRAVAGSKLSDNPVYLAKNSNDPYKHSGEQLFLLTTRSSDVLIQNIEMRYGALAVMGGDNHRFVGVKVFGASQTPAFQFGKNRLRNCLLRSCESGGNQEDGFNGGATSIVENDLLPGDYEVNIEQCWFHDCQGDGISEHGRGIYHVKDTLMEYNGISGSTPCGGNSVYTNCIFRKNGDGQRAGLYVLPSDNTVVSVTAIGCCSYDNNGADYGVLNSSIHVTNSKILLSLYNCSSLSSQPEKDCALTAQADGSRIATLATYNFVTNRVNKIKKSGSAQIIQIPEI